MDDNRTSVIRLRGLINHLSETLGDIVNDAEAIPPELRFNLALLDEYVIHRAFLSLF